MLDYFLRLLTFAQLRILYFMELARDTALYQWFFGNIAPPSVRPRLMRPRTGPRISLGLRRVEAPILAKKLTSPPTASESCDPVKCDGTSGETCAPVSTCNADGDVQKSEDAGTTSSDPYGSDSFESSTTLVREPSPTAADIEPRRGETPASNLVSTLMVEDTTDSGSE